MYEDMNTSHLENNKCGYSTKRSMYVRAVTILAVSVFFILHFPPSYADPTVIWDFFGGVTLGDGAAGSFPILFTITDPDANSDPEVVDTITATVTSIDLDGIVRDEIEITLSEVVSEEDTTPDPNSGIFRNKNIIFTNGQKEYGLDNTITIVQEDPDDFFGVFEFATTSPETIDTINGVYLVFSSSDPEDPEDPDNPGTFMTELGFPITETEPSSLIYTGTIRFSTEAGDFDSGTILVQPGDILSILPLQGGIRNALIVPNPDPRVGVLQAEIGDTITVTYAGIECADDFCDTVIGPGDGGGVGGGGPVLPSMSLVIDTLAGISSIQSIIAAGGGGLDKTPPSLTRPVSSGVQFDPFEPIAPTGSSLAGTTAQAPLRINQNGYNLYGYSNTIVTNTVETGQFTDMALSFNEASKVEHVAMYFVDPDRAEHSDTDPALIFDKGNIIKVDPQGIFGDDIQMSTSKEGTKSIFNFGMSFDKPTNKHIIIVAWDDKRNAGTTKVFNALAVVGNEIPNEVAHFMPIEQAGEFDLIKGDNGQYVLSQPAQTETVTDLPQTIAYPQFIGRLERHDAASLHDVINQEQQKAADIISSKMNVDNNLFSINQDTKLIDHSKRAPQLTSCGKYLGCELDRENTDVMKTLMWQEHLKAEKILASLIKSHRHY